MPSNAEPQSLLLIADNAGFSVFRELVTKRAVCIKLTLCSELSCIMAKNDTKVGRAGLDPQGNNALKPFRA